MDTVGKEKIRWTLRIVSHSPVVGNLGWGLMQCNVKATRDRRYHAVQYPYFRNTVKFYFS